jgi:hypothetical protein
MVLGLGGSESTVTPYAMLRREPIVSGQRFTVSMITQDYIPWSDVTIVLSDGQNAVLWHPLSEDLDIGSVSSHEYETLLLGDIEVTLSISDIAGNGMINSGDYMELVSSPAFSSSTDYSATVLYEINDEAMAWIVFTG